MKTIQRILAAVLLASGIQIPAVAQSQEPVQKRVLIPFQTEKQMPLRTERLSKSGLQTVSNETGVMPGRNEIIAFADSSSVWNDSITNPVPDMVEKTALVLWYNYTDGTKEEAYSFYLGDSPEINLSNGAIIVSSLGEDWIEQNEYEGYPSRHMLSFSLEMADKWDFTIEKRCYAGDAYYHQDAVNVDGVSDNVKPAFSVAGNVLTVNNLASNTEVMILDTAGKLLSSSLADANGNATLLLPSAQGTVIVNAGSINFKIMVK